MDHGALRGGPMALGEVVVDGRRTGVETFLVEEFADGDDFIRQIKGGLRGLSVRRSRPLSERFVAAGSVVNDLIGDLRLRHAGPGWRPIASTVTLDRFARSQSLLNDGDDVDPSKSTKQPAIPRRSLSAQRSANPCIAYEAEVLCSLQDQPYQQRLRPIKQLPGARRMTAITSWEESGHASSDVCGHAGSCSYPYFCRVAHLTAVGAGGLLGYRTTTDGMNIEHRWAVGGCPPVAPFGQRDNSGGKVSAFVCK